MSSDFTLFEHRHGPEAECKTCRTIFSYNPDKTRVLICPECGTREEI